MSHHRFASQLAALLVVLTAAAPIAAQPAAAKRDWKWLETGHFELLTDGPERPARQAIEELERFRGSIGHLLPKLEMPSSPPIRVVLFRDQRGYKPYLPLLDDGTPVNWGAFFWRDARASYIVMPANGSELAKRVVHHEFFHYLASSERDLPLWANEGLAEFYSTFSVNARKRHAEIGRPVPEHLRFLAENSALPLATLLTADQGSAEYHEEGLQGRFYSQSWLLVHWLQFGQVAPPGSFARYLNARREPAGEIAALEQAVGLPLERIEQELLRYRQRDLFTHRQVDLAELPSPPEPAVRAATTAEALVRLGELLASQGERRRAEAEEHFTAAGLDPERAAKSMRASTSMEVAPRPVPTAADPATPIAELAGLRDAWRGAPTDADAADRFATAVASQLGSDFISGELVAAAFGAARVAADAAPDSLQRLRRLLALDRAVGDRTGSRLELLTTAVERFPRELDLRLEVAQLELVAGDSARAAEHARLVLREAAPGDRKIQAAADIVSGEVLNRALALADADRLREAVAVLDAELEPSPTLPDGAALVHLASTREALREQLQIGDYNRAVELTRAKKYDAAARLLRTLLDEGAGGAEENARALLVKIEDYVRKTRG